MFAVVVRCSYTEVESCVGQMSACALCRFWRPSFQEVRQRVATALTGQRTVLPYTLHSSYSYFLEPDALMHVDCNSACILTAMSFVNRNTVCKTMNDGFTADPFLSLTSIVVDADQDKYLVTCSQWPHMSETLSHTQ